MSEAVDCPVIKEEKIDLSYEEGSAGKSQSSDIPGNFGSFAVKDEDEDSDEELDSESDSDSEENPGVERFSDKSETTDSESENEDQDDEDDNWELPHEAVIAAGNSGQLRSKNSHGIMERTGLSEGDSCFNPGSSGLGNLAAFDPGKTGSIPGNVDLEKARSHLKSIGLLEGNVGLFLGSNGLYLSRTDLPQNKGLPLANTAIPKKPEQGNPECLDVSQKSNVANAEMPIDLTGLPQAHSRTVGDSGYAESVGSVSDDVRKWVREQGELQVLKLAKEIQEGGQNVKNSPEEGKEKSGKVKHKRKRVSKRKKKPVEEKKRKVRKLNLGPVNGTSYNCPHCGKHYTQYRGLRLHVISVHEPDRPFLCYICGAGFKRQHILDNHMDTHDTSKKASCEICHKQFRHEKYLKRHMPIHDGSQKSFECEICQKQLKTKVTLKRHMDLHAPVRRLNAVCPICGKEICDLNLKRHIRTHSGEKPFPCEICGKPFQTPALRSAHQVIHSDECPFPCPECDMKFKRKVTLDRHFRIHTGEKPYECEQCGMRFRQKYVLTTHYKVHTGERRKKKMIAEMQSDDAEEQL